MPHESYLTQAAKMMNILTKFYAFHSILVEYKPKGSLETKGGVKDDNGLVQCDFTIQELSERHPVGDVDMDFVAQHAEFLLDNLGKQVDAKKSVILLSSIGIYHIEHP